MPTVRITLTDSNGHPAGMTVWPVPAATIQ